MMKIAISLAVLLEQFDESVWLDMYQAAPPEAVNSLGLSFETTGHGHQFYCTQIPFAHFNCAAPSGLERAFTKEELYNIVHSYREKGSPAVFTYLAPFTDPQSAEGLLKQAGFKPAGSWDRVYRNDAPLSPILPTSRNFSVETVQAATRDEWSSFVSGVYGFPTHSWLNAFFERAGWHHILLRENGKLTGARSFFIRDSLVWVGIDAPVPGVMSQDFEADYYLMYGLVEKALSLGGKHIIADIELPDESHASPAYAYFEALGFSVEYSRRIFVQEF